MPTGAAIPSLLISACFLLMLLSQPLWLCSASLGKPLYHEEECSALLGFKSSFFSESHCDYGDGIIGSPQKMLSWKVAKEGMAGDCCNWGGVTCDEGDGHVISLDLSGSCLMGIMDSEASIFDLLHLQDLNLAYNWFKRSRVPSAIGRLPRLKWLNLSSSGFSGEVVPATMRFLNLSSLDLSGNPGMNVSSLEVWLQSLNKIEELDLSWVRLHGAIPSSLGNMTNLTMLDLGGNMLSGDIPSSLGNLIRLNRLNLFSNQLAGEIPSFLGSLTNLRTLDLSDNRLSGKIRSTLGNLIRLNELGLRFNQLAGEIPSSLGNLTNLMMLRLSQNGLSGEIPSSFGNLIRLDELDLSSNQLAGKIPSSIRNLTGLTYLDLSSNELSGLLPHSIYQLQNLYSLDLSSNYLTGVARLDLLLELNGIMNVGLSSNAFSSIIFPEANASVTQVESLYLNSLDLKEVPGFLQQQNMLNTLSLSKNDISGCIPQWLLEKALDYLELSFNNIQGTLPMPPSTISFYRISNNRLFGEIPSSICKLQNMLVLDLADNNFTGELPPCFGNFSSHLYALSLRGNNFAGKIPKFNREGCQLSVVDLSANSFEGTLPRSIANCDQLEYVNLGKNKIIDTIPSCLGWFPRLRVLMLHSNMFHGVLKACGNDSCFPNLKVITLSKNNLQGRLTAEYFKNWPEMKYPTPDDEAPPGNLVDMLKMVIIDKGIKREFGKTSGYFALLDLSSNNFIGTIPESIGDNLLKLHTLNLSNNHFSGPIPLSLAKLSRLEALDLSRNKLSGEIPAMLMQVTSLEIFNVSYNNLSGPIPVGNQFSTSEVWETTAALTKFGAQSRAEVELDTGSGVDHSRDRTCRGFDRGGGVGAGVW
ncbi:hypothetical protein MLD38_035415 [Melastoma candidum]|uniref:Uncharacterized protein n=1 Tax=Melastoma candidum TaxID=119954 RepID=A0ACB9LHR4_9MYRT|nr:hypothetical protein MLD38_035415 [Melastoma candidum]